MPPLVTTLSSFLNLYQVSCRHNIPLWFSSLPTFPNWFSSHFDPYHLFPFFWAGRLSIFSRRLYIPANKLNLNSDEEKNIFVYKIFDCPLNVIFWNWNTFQFIRNKKLTNKGSQPLLNFSSPKSQRDALDIFDLQFSMINGLISFEVSQHKSF